MDGWMDCWMTNFTHAHTKTNIRQPCWEWCATLCISMQPRAMITINRAGFDVQALIPCDSPSALSHNNLDDYHSRRLMVVFVCGLSLFCSCLFLSVFACVCSWVCLCKCVCTLRHLLTCGIIAWLHNEAGVWQHQRLETKPNGWKSLFITAYQCFT